MTNKVLSNCKPTLLVDNSDHNDDSVMLDNESMSHEHTFPHLSLIDILEGMYGGTLKSSTFPFDNKHPDHSTHVMQILPPPHHYTLVPLGPLIPRRDRPISYVSYCQLMLIFFKPWIIASDLKPAHLSWSQALEQFIHSDNILHEHTLIIDNLQFLHTCCDSHDEASSNQSQKKRPLGIYQCNGHCSFLCTG